MDDVVVVVTCQHVVEGILDVSLEALHIFGEGCDMDIVDEMDPDVGVDEEFF